MNDSGCAGWVCKLKGLGSVRGRKFGDNEGGILNRASAPGGIGLDESEGSAFKDACTESISFGKSFFKNGKASVLFGSDKESDKEISTDWRPKQIDNTNFLLPTHPLKKYRVYLKKLLGRSLLHLGMIPRGMPKEMDLQHYKML